VNSEKVIVNYAIKCPKCGSYYKDIIQGKELNVKSMEILKE